MKKEVPGLYFGADIRSCGEVNPKGSTIVAATLPKEIVILSKVDGDGAVTVETQKKVFAIQPSEVVTLRYFQNLAIENLSECGVIVFDGMTTGTYISPGRTKPFMLGGTTIEVTANECKEITFNGQTIEPYTKETSVTRYPQYSQNNLLIYPPEAETPGA